MALSRRARLLGLALLDRRPPARGSCFPGCRSVHTFGMRFPLDLVFLDLSCVPSRCVVPCRPAGSRFERRAQAVLELPAGGTGRAPVGGP